MQLLHPQRQPLPRPKKHTHQPLPLPRAKFLTKTPQRLLMAGSAGCCCCCLLVNFTAPCYSCVKKETLKFTSAGDSS